MQFSLASLALAFISAVSAIEITSPTLGQKVDRSKTFDVTWTSVTTDVTNFTLAARLQGDASSDAVKAIAPATPTSAGKVTILGAGSIHKDEFANIPVFPVNGNYTIYALTNSLQKGILAQSQIFSVSGEPDGGLSGTSGSSSSATTGSDSASGSESDKNAITGTSGSTSKKGSDKSGANAMGLDSTSRLALIVGLVGAIGMTLAL